MRTRILRAVVALVLALAAGTIGYTAAGGTPALSAPAPGTTRVLYSLDEKQNDKELLAIINNAHEHIYFAIYVFTLDSVADALIAAHKRGIDVRGLIDSSEVADGYSARIAKRLSDAGIPLFVEKHEDGNGIMHIKLLVTESAYAFGSYNWTESATKSNDEILEIGTSEELRSTYEDLLLRLFRKYGGNAAAEAAASVSIGTIDYTEAPEHIGERASVRGTLVDTYTSASGTVFLDFCANYKTCPFSGVIFADDAATFPDIDAYTGRQVLLTGKIQRYEGRAEIILSERAQLSR